MTRLRLGWFVVALVASCLTAELGSESLVLQSYYPSPLGIYSNLTSTGQTILARDGQNVGVGTDSPAYKLDVAGAVNASDGVKVPIFTAQYAGGFVNAHGVCNGGNTDQGLLPGLTKTFTVNVPSNLDIAVTAIGFNDTPGGSMFTEVRVDGAFIGPTENGCRNPTAGIPTPGYWCPANSVWLQPVAAGQHTVEVHGVCDGNGRLTFGTGFLRIIAYPQ